MAVARDAWETGEGFAGPVMVARRGAIRVVCDATLYHGQALMARLREAGAEPASPAAADLIAAAWEAFGAECVEALEGDYAFCLWDGASGRLFCARDPFGSRSLFHQAADGGLVVASTPHPLVAARDRPPPFDLEGLLRVIAFRDGDGTRTEWKEIWELPAGWKLEWRASDPAGPARADRWWKVRGDAQWQRLRDGQAPEALRTLLAESASERWHPEGTALAMSGGKDSTAIAASLSTPPGAAAPRPLSLLSLRYPEDDPGNEDDAVLRVARHLGRTVTWVETERIPLLATPEEHLPRRSSAVGHAYEGQHRALAREARALGSRVLLNGHGGDNVFGVDPAWALPDLLRAGRLPAFRRLFRGLGLKGFSDLVDHGIRPALPLGALDLAERLRGRRIHARPLEHPLPPWISVDEALDAKLVRGDRRIHRELIVRPYTTEAMRRRAWGMLYPGFPRVCASLFDVVRSEGVEVRFPFYDRRLVTFALSRPLPELGRPGEPKALLAEAMQGHLPPPIVGSRSSGSPARKSGTSEGYFRSRFDREAPVVLDRLDSTPGPWRLESLGLVDPSAYRAAAERNQGKWRPHEVHLYLTLQAERWLRAVEAQAVEAQRGRPSPGAGSGPGGNAMGEREPMPDSPPGA